MLMRFPKADPVIKREQYFSFYILLKHAVTEQQVFCKENVSGLRFVARHTEPLTQMSATVKDFNLYKRSYVFKAIFV